MVKKTGTKKTKKSRVNPELLELNEKLMVDRNELKKNRKEDPTQEPLPVRVVEETRYKADTGEYEQEHTSFYDREGVEELQERKGSGSAGSAKPRQMDLRRASGNPDFSGAFGDDTHTKESTGEIVPAVQPQEPEAIGEAYGEAIAGALGNLQLTNGARQLLEMGLSGGVEIDTNAIFEELRELIASPVQGLLEAQRVGTLNKLYKAAEQTVDSLIEHLYVSSPATRVAFLKTLLSEIRKLQELGGVMSGGVKLPAGVQGGTMKLTRETMTIDLNKRTGKLKADKVLGHEGARPADDFLTAGK